ncbi:MAG: DNA-directed RNA polymerase subunit omega [Ignavibacteriaceae bacterium]|nr:DNA-directed RNA polymerase subunit omega [Ignavibacteriaceae bacterium]
MNIEPIDLREIDKRAANVYEAIIVAAKRSRQINAENKIEYNALTSSVPSSASDDENEDIQNPIQLKAALELDKRPKPHQIALDELLSDKIKFEYRKK